MSEYIGSHIFDILGYDVHETILGERNGKIVVACKDFTNGKNLLEIRAIKNYANKLLTEMLEQDMLSTGSNHYVDLEELLLHLEYNDILVNVPKIKERFWEQAVVDIFINNNDRNNGNWGILRDANGYDSLAPIFDNGGCLQAKVSESKIADLLSPERIDITIQNATNIQTVYAINEHILSGKNFLDLADSNEELQKALLRVVPIIEAKMQTIQELIQSIPTEYVGVNDKKYDICSENRKALYCLQLQARYKNLLNPAYEKMKEILEYQDLEYEPEEPKERAPKM